MVQVPYEYTVTVCRPETRTRNVSVCSYVRQTRSREVNYTVMVPETRTKTFNVTSYRCVPEKQVQTYTAMVRKTVMKEVHVRACKMVPKTITCRVPVYSQVASRCETCQN